VNICKNVGSPVLGLNTMLNRRTAIGWFEGNL